jgi:hypothetical protein
MKNQWSETFPLNYVFTRMRLNNNNRGTIELSPLERRQWYQCVKLFHSTFTFFCSTRQPGPTHKVEGVSSSLFSLLFALRTPSPRKRTRCPTKLHHHRHHRHPPPSPALQGQHQPLTLPHLKSSPAPAQYPTLVP